jgi:hypothetical protein
MNPFVNYDRADEAQNDKAAYQQARDEWIRDKADELSKKWPEQLSMFANPFLRVSLGLYDDESQDAYAEMVDKLCIAQATKQASENEWMNGTFREVA